MSSQRNVADGYGLSSQQFPDKNQRKLNRLKRPEKVLRDKYLYNEILAMEMYGAAIELDQLCNGVGLGPVIVDEIEKNEKRKKRAEIATLYSSSFLSSPDLLLTEE